MLPSCQRVCCTESMTSVSARMWRHSVRPVIECLIGVVSIVWCALRCLFTMVNSVRVKRLQYFADRGEDGWTEAQSPCSYCSCKSEDDGGELLSVTATARR
jgi:hypothetical protein